MKIMCAVTAITLLSTCPAWAQSGYITGVGGFATSPDTISGDLLGEVGIRIRPHIVAFGDIGEFHNLQPSDAQPAINSTAALLSSTGGPVVTATPRTPAWYSVGGIRYELPSESRLAPYVLGGAGFAHLMPSAQFSYTSGTLPDGATPAAGSDVTSQLTNAGRYIAPGASTAFMFTLGGGIDVPVARHWEVDAGYRFSRVEATTPLNAQSATLGVGYRF